MHCSTLGRQKLVKSTLSIGENSGYVCACVWVHACVEVVCVGTCLWVLCVCVCMGMCTL